MKLLSAIKLFNSIANILGFLCIFSLGLFTGSIFSGGGGPLAAALSETVAFIISSKVSLVLVLTAVVVFLTVSLFLKRAGTSIHLLGRVSGRL